MPTYFHRKPNCYRQLQVLSVTIDCNLFWSGHMTAWFKCTFKKICYLSKIKHFLNLHARKLFFMPIFNPSSTTDQRCRTRQMQILSNHWSERYIRALKAILVKTTTLAISDYNFLSIRPLKERLNKTREFWYTMLCPEKSHSLLRHSLLKPITTLWKTL